MSAWIYILELNNGHFYIGSTTNIEQRFLDHCCGKSPYAKKFLPVKLVFKKEAGNLSEANIIERKLKKMKSRKIIQKIVSSNILEIKI